jgi:hypothetical protein
VAARASRAVHDESSVTLNARIVPPIDHSPLQINRIFIVLFKPILDPAA